MICTHGREEEEGCIRLRFLRSGSPQIRPEGSDLGTYFYCWKPVLMRRQSWEPHPYFRNSMLQLTRSLSRSLLGSWTSGRPRSCHWFSQCAASSAAVASSCYTKWNMGFGSLDWVAAFPWSNKQHLRHIFKIQYRVIPCMGNSRLAHSGCQGHAGHMCDSTSMWFSTKIGPILLIFLANTCRGRVLKWMKPHETDSIA